jgi:hypothetical protein
VCNPVRDRQSKFKSVHCVSRCWTTKIQRATYKAISSVPIPKAFVCMWETKPVSTVDETSFRKCRNQGFVVEFRKLTFRGTSCTVSCRHHHHRESNHSTWRCSDKFCRRAGIPNWHPSNQSHLEQR